MTKLTSEGLSRNGYLRKAQFEIVSHRFYVYEVLVKCA